MCHDHHQSNAAEVSGFAGHVAAGYDLETGLLGGVNVVGDVFVFVDTFPDWVTAGFDTEGFGEDGADCKSGPSQKVRTRVIAWEWRVTYRSLGRCIDVRRNRAYLAFRFLRRL